MHPQVAPLLVVIAAGIALSACTPSAEGPMDDPAAETLGDQINEPTDGVANEMMVE